MFGCFDFESEFYNLGYIVNPSIVKQTLNINNDASVWKIYLLFIMPLRYTYYISLGKSTDEPTIVLIPW